MNVNGNNAVAKTQQQHNGGTQPTLKQWVARMSDQIKNALPANITPERMSRIALTALSKDAKLSECTPESFMGALLTSAQLGLECNTPLGQAYLIPFWNSKKGCLETQFQLGYQGLIDLCYRTGQYKKIVARVVYGGDDFDYSYGLDEQLIHRPKEKSEKPIYVYALYELKNGASAFEVMSWKAIEAHAKKYSQSVQKGYMSPWSTDPQSMAKKTVLKKVLKYAPKAVESAELVAEAVNGDSAIIKTNVIKDGNEFTFTKDFDYSPETAEVEEKIPEKIEQKKNEQTKGLPDESAVNEAELDAAFVAQAEMYDNGDIPSGDELF